ncbi:MAG: DNA replication/repair protein RecF [Chitinophagales bacterium]|nr:DNA replication/repair protein RecF [Chitinophagales bacterium]
MKSLKKITLAQFRNYSAASYAFSARITCITGPNGSGKTNLLDAIYYLCYTKSYFSAYQQNTAQSGTDGFSVRGEFEHADAPETIACKWQQGKKEVSANNVEYEKVTDHIGKYAAVMIAPDDLELLNGSSEQRRKWVDSILFQTDKDYMEALVQYQRVLMQRNAWLKQENAKPRNNFTELEFYDAKLAADGDYIYKRREEFLQKLLPLLNKYYHELSHGKEELGAEYKTHLHSAPMTQLLKKSLPNDLQMQRTLKGIHRDDWDFTLDSLPLKQFASQGQKKSFLFALKLAQYSYLEAEQGNMPMLLLDDIFEKLDANRIRSLLNIIRSEGFGQVFLTDTDKARVAEAFGEGEGVTYIEV